PDQAFPPGLQACFDTALARPAAVAAAPDRTRRLAPIALGVVALLGAGGAGLFLLGGDNDATGEPAPGDTTTHAANVGPPRQPRDTPERRETATRAGIDVTHARALLDQLFLEVLSPATAALVRDSALAIYRAPGLGRADSAYAAFVVGQAHFNLRGPGGELDRTGGCEWIRRATRLDPSSTVYAGVMPQCRG
ncbi:MAG: hypothetical protein ACREMJ_06850, partial [Gemmatimonadales bacterium]